MNSTRRSPWLTLSALLVYVFLYAPIVVLVVFSFNASRTNIVFEGVVNQGPCGPFYWYCQLFRNRDVMEATRNTLVIALTSTFFATIIGTLAALALQRYEFPRQTRLGDGALLPHRHAGDRDGHRHPGALQRRFQLDQHGAGPGAGAAAEHGHGHGDRLAHRL
jgi:ABC-type Fe3+ transport system permease subunit